VSSEEEEEEEKEEEEKEEAPHPASCDLPNTLLGGCRMPHAFADRRSASCTRSAFDVGPRCPWVRGLGVSMCSGREAEYRGQRTYHAAHSAQA
jgi:hypothetical protein